MLPPRARTPSLPLPHPDYIYRCRDRIAAFSRSFEERGETAPFLFLVNILIPGTPIVSTVIYWALVDEGAAGGGGGDGNFLDMLSRCG